ncbi:MAG: rRNA maturation RNase YbeY [Spirochaetales bacterium]|jgi:probable rRNA maturation factor|nr:rRNA maturation RNase YbeY [Spirochaetales bacterium]
MNRIMICAQDREKPKWAAAAAAFCKKVLRKLSLDNYELSVVLCSNGFIRDLNKRFRSKDEATDILSFSQVEGGCFPCAGEGAHVIGDMVISLDMLEETGRKFSVSEEEELKRLLIHGVLHLAGQDHAGSDPRDPMLMRQEEILQELSEEKIF